MSSRFKIDKKKHRIRMFSVPNDMQPLVDLFEEQYRAGYDPGQLSLVTVRPSTGWTQFMYDHTKGLKK